MRVFISYRRLDSSGHVHEIAPLLRASLIAGEACEVFLDVDVISPGRDFVKAITAALESSDVALAVIGRHWLVADDVRRLDDPTDMVRLELRTALATKTPLIVVLVDRGALPQPSELPPDIRGLTAVKTVHIRDESFDGDVERLVSAIASVGKRSPRAPAPAVLRLVNAGGAWLTSGDQYTVQVDGKNAGTLISGKAPTDLTLPPGKRSVRLKRGLRHSEPVTVTLTPGQTTSLAYEVGLWGISLHTVTDP